MTPLTPFKEAIENRTRLRKLVKDQYPLIYEWIFAELYAQELLNQDSIERITRSFQYLEDEIHTRS